MSVPTQGEAFSKLLYHLGEAQSQCAIIAHLTRAMSDTSRDHALADGWISMAEMIKRITYQVTKIAQGKLQ